MTNEKQEAAFSRSLPRLVRVVDAGPAKAYCPDCKWRGDASACDTDVEQESHETSPYGIACCPMCQEWNVEFIPNAHLSGGTLSAQSDCSQEAGNA